MERAASASLHTRTKHIAQLCLQLCLQSDKNAPMNVHIARTHLARDRRLRDASVRVYSNVQDDYAMSRC